MNPSERTYHRRARAEVIPYVPVHARTVLDVGCASGEFGRALLEARPGTIIDGVEANEEVTAEAAVAYRGLAIGLFPDARPAARYDAIVCNDVLEHMADPWAAVRVAGEMLMPGGVIVASLPNMRYWPVMRALIGGRWDYGDEGVLDRTHLRWFTKATMVELFTNAGMVVDTVEPLSQMRLGRKWKVMRRIAGDTVDDLATMQYVVVARNPGQTDSL